MMEIKTEDFKRALEIVKPGITSKETIEQSTHFAFVGDRVYSYNDEICITGSIEGLDLTGAIAANELYQFISKQTKAPETFTITVKDTQVVVKLGRSIGGFVFQPEIKLPIDNEELQAKGKWKSLPVDFNEALNFVSKSSSTETLIPTTMCVHITGDFVEGTDMYRLSHWKLDGFGFNNKILIPAVWVRFIVAFNPVKISSDGKAWVHFKDADRNTFSCRLYQDRFKDTSPLINSPTKKGSKIVFPEQIYSVIERAEVFVTDSKTTNGNITVDIEEKKITITSKSELGSWFKETLPFKHKGESYTFNVAPILLKSILKMTNECTFYGNILRFEKDNWIHITSLKK